MRPPDKIYLAARWSRREELEALIPSLVGAGYDVTSRWITDPQHRMADQPDAQAFNAELARHDVADVQKADALIFFAPRGTRGGSDVEFGMALALRKRLFWVGERSHVFSFLPSVEVYETWPELLAYLRGLRQGYDKWAEEPVSEMPR